MNTAGSLARAFARLWLGLVLALALGWSAQPAAQSPKVGSDYYVDDAVLGFKVKYPREWVFIPPQPNDANLLGKYDPPTNKWVDLGGDRDLLFLHAWLLKFDRRAPEEDEEGEGAQKDDGKKSVDITVTYQADTLEQWIKDQMQGESQGSGGDWRVDSKKETKVDGLPATEYVFLSHTTSESKTPVRAYGLVVHLMPDLDVAMLYNGPGKDRDWPEYQTIYRRLAESFKRVPVLAPVATKASKKNATALYNPGPPSALKDKKRAELQERMRTTPGWALYESPNYFIVSNVDDKPFVAEVVERLEAIRSIYVKDYPKERAEAARARAKARTGSDVAGGEADAGDDKKGGDEGDDAEPKGPAAPRIDPNLDPAEVGRTSVVRVCATSDEYRSYGGPPGSAGYWYNVTQELVIYDDKKGGGRNDTWATLNHEAFHQFIFYYYGNIAPHSWYNEGTGDFYGGYDYSHGKYTLKPFKWRTDTIRGMLNEGRYVPLKEFIKFKQPQYYGTSKYKTDIGDHYAQGWSFIYFLRTGKGKARGWNSAWDKILDTYLDTLAETQKVDKAAEAAFKDVDFDALEKAWKAYIG